MTLNTSSLSSSSQNKIITSSRKRHFNSVKSLKTKRPKTTQSSSLTDFLTRDTAIIAQAVVYRMHYGRSRREIVYIILQKVKKNEL